ncbi:serine protease [Erysipelothrix larvae]|uniref:Serine protease n=2 Tax=Erysipelothrix larvae TaxID=1514105 RepID=A0A0X8H1Q7_9FIRM|nr:serine protease [Erysipelothrix larvae]
MVHREVLMKKKLIGILIAALFVWNGYLTYSLINLENKPTTSTDSSGNTETQNFVSNIESNVSKVNEAVESKVVSVINKNNGTTIGSGSGVIYKNENGVISIITNHHVIDSGNEYSVRFSNGQEETAELVGSDEYSDIALLTVKKDYDIEPFKLGDSSLLNVGEFVIAIGSPLGVEFSNSTTFGIISGKDRVVSVDLNGDGVADWDMVVLQTDAAINPGNSGGALVNMQGELIGINSMKISSDNVEGMGFSIPINEVIPIVTQLEENGKVTYPIIGISGVSISDLNSFNLQYYGLKQDDKGVFIVEVTKGGPADEAGVKQYDIITSIDGVEVTSFKDFRRILYSKSVGDHVKITVTRDGASQEIEVVLK